MTTTPSRRPKAAIVPHNAIDQASALLQQLPEKPKESLSLRETVAKLQDQIKAALAKGYSYEEVAQLLSGQGINISPSTLKNYIPSSRRQAAAEEPAATKTRKRRSKKQLDQDGESTESEPIATDSPMALLNGLSVAAAPDDADEDEDEDDEDSEAAIEETFQPEEPAPKKPGRRGRPSAASKAASEPQPKTRGRRANAAKAAPATTTRRRKKADA